MQSELLINFSSQTTGGIVLGFKMPDSTKLQHRFSRDLTLKVCISPQGHVHCIWLFLNRVSTSTFSVMATSLAHSDYALLRFHGLLIG